MGGSVVDGGSQSNNKKPTNRISILQSGYMTGSTNGGSNFASTAAHGGASTSAQKTNYKLAKSNLFSSAKPGTSLKERSNDGFDEEDERASDIDDSSFQNIQISVHKKDKVRGSEEHIQDGFNTL